MADSNDDKPRAEGAIRGLSHSDSQTREALDAANLTRLQKDPENADAKADVGSDESFPASDPPAVVQPCKSDEPSPSTGYKGS